MDSSLLFNLATLAYLVAMVLYISYLAFRKEGIGKIASMVTMTGLVVQTVALFLRWRESYQMDIGRVPLSNLYESLVFFTWSTVLIYLICIGPLIAFFGSHRKLWVRVQDRAGQAVIMVAGTVNRNRMGFEREFNMIFDEISK